ncbi:MAG: hypothetical protein M0Z99_29335 [Betaproteobacteria bacterium]|nr:hypothetical protein [Betaproteobacteria bacterium]
MQLKVIAARQQQQAGSQQVAFLDIQPHFCTRCLSTANCASSCGASLQRRDIRCAGSGAPAAFAMALAVAARALESLIRPGLPAVADSAMVEKYFSGARSAPSAAGIAGPFGILRWIQRYLPVKTAAPRNGAISIGLG